MGFQEQREMQIQKRKKVENKKTEREMERRTILGVESQGERKTKVSAEKENQKVVKVELKLRVERERITKLRVETRKDKSQNPKKKWQNPTSWREKNCMLKSSELNLPWHSSKTVENCQLQSHQFLDTAKED